MIFRAIVCLVVCILFAELAHAEKPRPVGKTEEGDFVIEKRPDGSVVKYKKKTSYDFEGTGIEGLYNKPSGAYISNIKQVKGKSIIRMRENFDAEVIDSSRLMK
jgi:hypothetical protein